MTECRNLHPWLHGTDSLQQGRVFGLLLAGEAAVADLHAAQGTRAVGPLLAGIAVALEWLGCGADITSFDRGDG